MDRTPEQAAAILRRIPQLLKQPGGLAHKYAEAVLVIARQTAASRPTPQARMAAAGMSVQGDTINPPAGGPPAEVAVSSEFGSDIYLQFQKPHSARGYWLYPSAESSQAETAGDKALIDVLRSAV